MILTAISPRLAIRTFLNMRWGRRFACRVWARESPAHPLSLNPLVHPFPECLTQRAFHDLASAGLRQRRRRELDRAWQLEPGDALFQEFEQRFSSELLS